MNPRLSFRLDAMRAIAALAVFCSHFAQLGLVGGTPDTLWALGRIGVVAFFVMSGYVIAYTAESKHPAWRGYFEARLARLWSVFLPALALTAGLDIAGRWLDPFLYARIPAATNWRTLAMVPFFATFTFENAWFSLRWLSNGPMWSIAYEFWYYVLFGVVVYAPPARRLPLLGLALVLAGWKILLLAPLWAAGVVLYRYRNVFARLPAATCGALCSAGLAGVAVLLTPWAHAATLPLREWGDRVGPHGFHSYFVSDYLFALPVILLVAGMAGARAGEPAPHAGRVARWAAGFSFSVYLLHVPLVLFLRAADCYDPASLPESLGAAALVILLCYLCATCTEHRKHFWRNVVSAAWLRKRRRDARGKTLQA